MKPVRLEPVALGSRVKHSFTTLPLKIQKFNNNLDPGQATMVDFPDLGKNRCYYNQNNCGGTKDNVFPSK